MTLQELCQITGKSENTLKNSFNRTKENLAKKGIFISKIGRGENTEYFLEYKDTELKLKTEQEIINFLNKMKFKVYRGVNIFDMVLLEKMSQEDKIQYSEDDEDYIIVSFTRAYELQNMKE